MPLYRCHKHVRALKIGAVDPHNMLVPADRTFAPFFVDDAYMAKHAPAVGGYYVVYEDGYTSYSPAKAFEDGYTRVA